MRSPARSFARSAVRVSVCPCVSQRMYFELLRCKFKKDDASATAAAATENSPLGSTQLDSTRLVSKNGKTKGYCDKDLLVCPPTATSTGLSDARPLSCVFCLPLPSLHCPLLGRACPLSFMNFRVDLRHKQMQQANEMAGRQRVKEGGGRGRGERRRERDIQKRRMRNGGRDALHSLLCCTWQFHFLSPSVDPPASARSALMSRRQFANQLGKVTCCLSASVSLSCYLFLYSPSSALIIHLAATL